MDKRLLLLARNFINAHKIQGSWDLLVEIDKHLVEDKGLSRDEVETIALKTTSMCEHFEIFPGTSYYPGDLTALVEFANVCFKAGKQSSEKQNG